MKFGTLLSSYSYDFLLLFIFLKRTAIYPALYKTACHVLACKKGLSKFEMNSSTYERRSLVTMCCFIQNVLFLQYLLAGENLDVFLEVFAWMLCLLRCSQALSCLLALSTWGPRSAVLAEQRWDIRSAPKYRLPYESHSNFLCREKLHSPKALLCLPCLHACCLCWSQTTQLYSLEQ